MSDEIEEPEVGSAKAPVPYERFAGVVSERNAARKELEALRPQVGLLDVATKERDALREQLAAVASEHSDAIALLRAGVDDEDGQTVARALYGRMPADGRPASIGEWLGGMKADPAAVPRGLAPYLLPPAAPVAAPPKPAAPNGQAPPATGSARDAQIRAAREHLRLTGDGADLRKLLGTG